MGLKNLSKFDVVVLGAGPVGLTLANYLGLYGLKTLLIEKNASTVSEPRAVTIDDESMRAMQGIGLADEVLSTIMPGYGSNYLSSNGRSFAKVLPTTREYGFLRRNAVHQDVLEAQLRNGLSEHDEVTQWFEHELIQFSQDKNAVYLEVRSRDGVIKAVECGHLCACDGARSTVRRQLGIEVQGTTYSEQWLIVDILNTKDPYRHTQVYCDPRRPGISLPGPRRTRRFEFMLLKGEDPEKVVDEANVRKLLREHGPDENAVIRRKTVYTFHARIATEWQRGRITLHGDAAHLTPPFAGQGMNSGVRDAHNFAWKIAAVTKGLLGDGLLKTYQQERYDHAWSLIEMAIRMGHVMMPLTQTRARLTQAAFSFLKLFPPAYDYVAQMKYKPKPRFKLGFFVDDSLDSKKTLIGRMFRQPRVALPNDKVLMLDDVLGAGFSLLTYSESPDDIFEKIPRDIMGEIEIKRLCITPQDINFPDSDKYEYVRDVDGDVAKALDGYPECALLLRPDRYVAAVITQYEAEKACHDIRLLFSETWKEKPLVNSRVNKKAAA